MSEPIDLPPTEVPLGPVPTTVSIGQTQVGTETRIVLAIQTPVGHSVYFLDGDTASALGRELTERGALARLGLVVPGVGAPASNGN